MRLTSLFLAAAMWACAPPVVVAQSEGMHQPTALQQQEFEARANSIEALLGAYRGMAGADQARLLQDRVDAMLQQARALYSDGEPVRGRALLDQAYNTVRGAIVQSRDGQTLTNSRAAGEQYQIRSPGDGVERAHQSRLDSIDALFAAYARVAGEKALPGRANLMAGDLGQLKQRAEAAYRQGDPETGKALLDDAYVLVKMALSALREGETLVRSLDFSSPQDEYAYYLDKTSSQRQAIGIMLDASDDDSRRAMLVKLLDGARWQVDQAAAHAAKGHYEQAIPIMDKVFSRLQTGLMMSLSAP